MQVLFFRFTLFLLIMFTCSPAFSQKPPDLPEPPVKASQNNDEAEGRRLFMLGITEFELENYSDAIDYLLEARAILGGSAGLDYSLADAYFQTNDLVNASQYGKNAVEADPKNKWYRLKLAEIYRKAGRNQATIDELNAVLELYPADIEVMYNLAQVQTSHGKLLDANNTYNRILQLNGPDTQLYFQKYRNFRTLGQRDSAIVQLNNMLDYEPDNIAALQTLSRFYLEEDDFKQARETLERALKIKPGDVETIIATADLYAREGLWNEATNLFNRLITNPDVEPMTKVELGQYILNQFIRDQGNEALKESTEQIISLIVEEEPEFGYAWALAAEYYSNIGDDDSLLSVLIETNRLLPENEPAWRQRIQLHLVNDDPDAAIEAGLSADEAIPDDAFVLFLVGNAYLMKSEPKQAIEWLERASAAPSQRDFRSSIYTTLGDSYSQQETWEKADEAYEMALRLNAANDVALNNYAYFLSDRDVRLDDALEMAEKAIAAEPENASYLDTVGWIHYKLGNYEEALKFILASVETGRASAVVMDHLGDVYDALGDTEKAREWWQKSLEKDPDKESVNEKLSE